MTQDAHLLVNLKLEELSQRFCFIDHKMCVLIPEVVFSWLSPGHICCFDLLSCHPN